MSPVRKLDAYDRRILAKLQVQGDLGAAELSEMIHLSMSQCSRRLQRLRTEGYVQGIVAVLDRTRLRLGFVVYVRATLKTHTAESATAFREWIGSVPEITECHKLAGEADYLLKVCTKSVETYNELLNTQLLRAPQIAHVQSSVVLESLKNTTALPLEFV